jgi:fermentation-respiration switch protein FrsA (DUF1100 family)
MNVLLVAVALGAAIVGTLVLLLWVSQERIVFQPPGPPYPTANHIRRIDYIAADGQPLFAWVVGDPTSPSGLLIVFHGNADLAGWQIPWAEEVVRRTGRAVVIPEYRGYAGLPGSPTYLGGSLDARAAYAIARDTLDVPASRIALFGHSLGSAIAAELARDVAPEVLLLQSPFTSARDMARLIAARPLILVWRSVARVHYDTEAIVKTLPTPVWIIHGSHDGVIPVDMGKRLFRTARVPGELVIIDGADHNDLATHAPERYWAWLVRALGRTAGTNSIP